MYVVKDSRPRYPQQPQSQPPAINQPPQPAARPILQYGPPNGSMPPPPTPKTVAATPSVADATPPKALQPSPVSHTVQPADSSDVPKSPGQNQARPSAPTSYTTASQSPQPQAGPATSPRAPQSSAVPVTGSIPNPPSAANAPTPDSTTTQPAAPSSSGVSSSDSKPASKATPTKSKKDAKAPPNDPVIALLAQKASNDDSLRTLMQRVATGQAKDGELAQFQKVIDQLNAEYRQKGGQQGASAERLIVDGRTVKYFADEVNTILGIVLATNPNQRSSELRPPPRSDPLVVLLVKTALEDQRTKDMIKRIAEGRPGPFDAVDLKEIVDRLHRDAKTTPQAAAVPTPVKQPAPNGLVQNGHAKAPAPQAPVQPGSQALRSKGPPPAPKLDISAVVLDFGSGDRYLFPKYSILEYLPTQSGQQVVASFLIVRKGSTSEYGGDPKLDYYQPVTVRLYTHAGRSLENLARVVAPQDEVRRYMDDVMDNMTRAEYVLLAMRLPREGTEERKEAVSDAPRQNGKTPQPEQEPTPVPEAKPSVLWTKSLASSSIPHDMSQSSRLRDAEQETQATYQRLIKSVAAKNVEQI